VKVRPSWRRLADSAASRIGTREGALLLHVSDIHNSIGGFRFAVALADALAPDLVVDTGDLSGVGGLAEAALLRTVYRIRWPHVLSPGNHDSVVTNRVLRRSGAVVLDRPMLATVAAIRVWGYPDPNRSPLFGPAYDSRLCRAAARVIQPPGGGKPFIVAVHNSRMVERPPPEVGLVLSGHRHQPAVARRGGPLFVRCGSTGGGGPFGGALQAAVVDLAMPGHRPLRVWIVETHGGDVSVHEVPF
jgi:predicted MPP superfamily phosphohydrolase